MHVVIKQLSAEEIKHLGIYNWPVWTKEISVFDWAYDSQEDCYILEGEAEVICSLGEKCTFKAGDFVTFPKGLTCKWIVKKPVRKHYRFS
jgi:uncharacterized cupin superfamily protein